MFSVLLSLALAVEGMWLPEDLLSRADSMKKAGFNGDVKALSRLDAAPFGAVVSLGGCTASFVSSDGLIVTNHHCAVGFLQQASGDGEDLVDTGFYAKSREEERSGGPQARVYVVLRSEDVTRSMVEALPLDSIPRALELERREKKLVADCEKDGLRCRVSSFYEGSMYRRTASLELRDIRLVAAPPDSVGNYGDQIDNWHWPRHSGDFAFIRAYVGKDGHPSDYSADNVPYRPAQFLQVAEKSVGEGDFVMVAGFPGRTFRWKTAEELSRAVEVEMPQRIQELDRIEKALIAAYTADPSLKVVLEPQRLGTANRLNKLRGIVRGLSVPGLLEKRRAREQALREFMAKDPKFAGVSAALDGLLARSDSRWGMNFAMEIVGISSPLFSLANLIDERAVQHLRPNDLRDAGYQDRDDADIRDTVDAFQRRVEPSTDRALLEKALERVLALPPAQGVPELVNWVRTEGGQKTALDHLYAGPILADLSGRRALLDRTAGQLATLTDAFVRMAVAMRPYRDREHNITRDMAGQSSRWRPLRATAMQQRFPELAYPDANGTFRVTYGTVQGYSPGDATVYGAQTTLAGLVAKAGPAPFDAPPALLAAAKGAPRVPVNFLSDLDITGGNSGSPTLNAKGELVGLVFDGVWEGVASDWIFDPVHTRAVHVDVGYIRWYLQNVMGAQRVLAEWGH